MTASKIMIAVGTRPARPASVEFDGHTILDSDDILNLDWIPSSLVVVGAGVIGIEYASMFAALGTQGDGDRAAHRGCSSSATRRSSRRCSTTCATWASCSGSARRSPRVEKHHGGAIAHLASGKRIPADAVLYSAGRQGATDGLDLERAGLEADERGRIAVNAQLPHQGARTSTRRAT